MEPKDVQGAESWSEWMAVGGSLAVAACTSRAPDGASTASQQPPPSAAGSGPGDPKTVAEPEGSQMSSASQAEASAVVTVDAAPSVDGGAAQTHDGSSETEGASAPSSAVARPLELVDLHAHFLPSSYVEAATRAGKTAEGRKQWPDWSFDRQIALMDQAGIAVSVLSVGAPGVHFGDDMAAVALASFVNDEASALVRRAPERLRFLASLPLPQVDHAITEWRRARELPGCVGVIVFSNILGIYVGDARFEALWTELGTAPTVVLVHPAEPPELSLVSPEEPSGTQECYFESARACLSMFEASLVTRYPNLRFVIPNCGGALPILFDRLVTFGTAGYGLDPAITMREHMCLWFDCAGTPLPTQLPALLQRTTRDRVVYGSESCFTPDLNVLAQITTLEREPLPDGRTLHGALVENGKRAEFAIVTRDVR